MKTIAQIEINIINKNYFRIFHIDPVTNELFRFNWNLVDKNSEELRQTKEYFAHLLNRQGIFNVEPIYNKIDQWCKELAESKDHYRFYNIEV